MKYTILLLLFSCGFYCSCKLSWHSGKNEVHYLNDEYGFRYDDEKRETIKKLETGIDTFAYFYTFRSNADHFPEFYIDDNFIWVKGNKQLKKTLKKNSNDEFYISKTFAVNSRDLFNLFTSKRMDTVQTLPRINGNLPIIHGYTDCYYPPKSILKIKCGKYSYSKTFEPQKVFNTIDTLHPVYIFVKQLKAL